MTTLRKLFRTTTFRTALFLAVLFASAAMLTIVYIYWNSSRLLDARLTETLLAETLGLAEQYRSGGIRRLAEVIGQRVSNPSNTIYLVTDENGGWIAGNVKALTRELWDQQGRVEFEYRRAGPDGVNMRHAIANIYRLAAGYRLMVGRDIEDQRVYGAVFRNAVLSGLIFMVLFGLGGGWFVSRNLLKRIDAVTETSRVIMRGDMSGRVPTNGSGDEIDRLAVNLNAMLERIDQLMSGLREVSDNIAHDLKTPLSRMRSRVETTLREGDSAAYRGALERTIEESDELIRIFNALLSIARLETGSAQGNFAAHNVRDILCDVAELYEPLAELEGMDFALVDNGALHIYGDRQLVGQAIANLLDNAIKYGRPPETNERGTIRLWAGQIDGKCHICVADRGPGIAPQEREHAMKRFGRLEKSRSRPGTGLGLSLAAAVARLHGGELVLESNSPGLLCRLIIPCSPPSAEDGSESLG